MTRARGGVAVALALLALTALVVGRAAASRAALPHDLTIFTVASDVQFINTADDRARGAINNPFDAATNNLRPKTSGTGDGPFPGDVVVFNFDLYPKLPVKKKIGSASYTCYFNYTRHALCQAYYELHGGTLTAAGPVDFNATSFKLVVTGGTNAYLAARGQVTSNKSQDNAQRVDFRLLG
jgi:hypothetical protein